MVFFDYNAEAEKCLCDIITRMNYHRFVSYSVDKEVSGNFYVLDVSYANFGRETLERFVGLYPSQLGPASEMAFQLSNIKYVE